MFIVLLSSIVNASQVIKNVKFNLPLEKCI